MIFIGAEEYWSYKGLTDGFTTKKIVDKFDVVDSIFNNKTGLECKKCYLLGFELGKEIRRDVEEEKEKRRKKTNLRFNGTKTGRFRLSVPNRKSELQPS